MNHLLPAVLNIRGLLVQLRPGRGYDNPSVFGFFILLFIVPIAIVFIFKDLYSRPRARQLNAGSYPLFP